MNELPAQVRIVVLLGSGLTSSQLSSGAGEPSILERILEEAGNQVTVSVISLGLSHAIPGIENHIRLFNTDYGTLDRLFRSCGLFGLRQKLAKYSIGRLLNSMAPFDQGRVFWRSVRRNAESRALLASSDIAIAADIQSTRTAWVAVRRHWVDQALYDHRASSIWDLKSRPVTDS
jgi:hypothetical protein